MREFKLQQRTIDFRISDENGGLIKEYKVSVGNESFLRDIMTRGKAVVAEIESIDKNDLSQSVDAMRKFVDLIFGNGEFDLLYEKFGRNVFGMIDLVGAISEEITAKWKERTSAYV